MMSDTADPSGALRENRPIRLCVLESEEAGTVHCPLSSAAVLRPITTTDVRADHFASLAERHPCLSASGHTRFGRMHLPVSPTCNIQCRFCRRGFNKNEERPGVARRLLAPEEAVEKVRRALELCPDITVVGISGPGDTLATDHAIRTFAAVHQAYPHLIKCLSTNGLKLADRAATLWDVGVRTVTVTVNAVDPEILERICAWVVWRGARLKGRPAAERLITQQFLGIRLMADLGAFVKINTVLIPGVNDFHVAELARTTAGLGAARINLIPLIPQHEMSGIPAPNCAELERARRDAGRYLEVFRHCKHCRADACGVPGRNHDLAGDLYEMRVPETFSHG